MPKKAKRSNPSAAFNNTILKNNAGTQPVFLFILFQIVAYLILRNNGHGIAYMYMMIPLEVIAFGGWAIAYFRHANTAFFLDSVMILTFGTMIQCMLMDEDTMNVSLMAFYVVAFAAGLAAAFLYKRLPIIASANAVSFFIVLTFLLYLATLVMGSSGAGGVTNWIALGSFKFQPSEFIKGLYVLVMAGLLCTKDNPGRKRILIACVYTFLNLGFLVLQGEFGTILLILASFICLIFLFVPDIKWFIGIVAVLGALGAVGIAMCSALLKIGGNGFLVRQVEKIINRFAPWIYLNFGKNPTDLTTEQYQSANYQVLQGRKALLNSSFLGSDTTTPIPNKVNDSIFPALTESCGIIIALIVVVLFIMLLVHGTRIYIQCPDRYHQAIAAGLTLQLIIQALIIIGGSIGLLPLTGITLPLISLGGSSLVSTFMFLAVILSISSGNLWNGRRDYKAYGSKLSKARPVRLNRDAGRSNRHLRRRSDDDDRKSGQP